MKKGCFITLEGIEGVGKSTQITYIKSLLEEKKLSVVVTREPGGTPAAEDMRHIFSTHYEEKITPAADCLLLFAGRAQHVENLILPSLNQGKWVVSDRFIDASYAYQGAGRHVPQTILNDLTHWICDACQPDLTLLLDLPVEAGLQRMNSRGEKDRTESEKASFFERVRQAYLERAKAHPQRIKVIDASGSIEEVQAAIKKVLMSFMERHKP